MSPRTAVLTVLACGVFALVLFRPVRDVDMFWQVRTGELMIETGRLVTADPFTSTHAGEPTPTIYWLSQLLYAGLLEVGSWELLHRLDALLFAAALWLAAVGGRTRGGSPFAAAAALGLALLIAMPHHGLRPQTFGLLGFAAVVALDRSGLGVWRKTLATLAVCVVWQNLHPSASTGALYLGVVVAAGFARWSVTRGGPFPWRSGLPVVAAGLAVFLTPDGVGILRLSAENAAVARAIGVEEWLPAWDPATWPAARTVWLGVAVTLGLALAVRGRGTWEEFAVAVVFTAAAVGVYRLSLFWAVAMISVWCRWLEVAYPRLASDSPATLRVRPVLVLPAILGAALVAAVVRPAVFDPNLPFAGLDRVRALRVSGVVYNYREWGGPLIASAHPSVRVTIDGRLYLYPAADWDDYLRTALGEVPLDEVEARYRPDAFFLRPSYHERLIALLRASDQWEEAYADRSCVLFVKPTVGRSASTPGPIK
jgi:hypothetical protein